MLMALGPTGQGHKLENCNIAMCIDIAIERHYLARHMYVIHKTLRKCLLYSEKSKDYAYFNTMYTKKFDNFFHTG